MNKKFYEYGRSFEDWNCVLKLEISSTISTCLLTATGVFILLSAMQFLCIPNLWSRAVYLRRNPLCSYTFNLNAISSSNWNLIFEYKVNRITIHIKPSPSAVQYQTFTLVEKASFTLNPHALLLQDFKTAIISSIHMRKEKNVQKYYLFVHASASTVILLLKDFPKMAFFCQKKPLHMEIHLSARGNFCTIGGKFLE